MKSKKISSAWNKTKSQKSFLSKIDDYLISKQSLTVKDKVIFFRFTFYYVKFWNYSFKMSCYFRKTRKKQTVLKNILNRFVKELKEWKWLSECLSLYPASFSPAEVWMIESWEKTWKLNVSLKDLAEQVEKMASINGKLKSALMYPAMIVIVVIWVIIVMMTMVVPKLLEIFCMSWKSSMDNTITYCHFRFFRLLLVVILNYCILKYCLSF